MSFQLQLSTSSQISHILRTPVTGLLGAVKRFEKTPLDPQQKEYLEDIVRCARELLDSESTLKLLLKPQQK